MPFCASPVFWWWPVARHLRETAAQPVSPAAPRGTCPGRPGCRVHRVARSRLRAPQTVRGMVVPSALRMSAARCSISGWMTRWASSTRRSARSRRGPPASAMREAPPPRQAAARHNPAIKAPSLAVKAALAKVGCAPSAALARARVAMRVAIAVPPPAAAPRTGVSRCRRRQRRPGPGCPLRRR